MIKTISEGLILGLSTGGFCLGACAPVFVPYLLAEGAETYRRLIWQIIQLLAGRLTAYILFAVIACWLGKEFGSILTARFTGILIITTAVLLLLYSFVKNMPKLDFCKKTGASGFIKNIPFLFGFLIGLNPCPPFLVGTARVLELGSVYLSVIFFISFFAGTSVCLTPLLFLKPALKYERVKTIGQLASILAGIYFLITGLLLPTS